LILFSVVVKLDSPSPLILRYRMEFQAAQILYIIWICRRMNTWMQLNQLEIFYSTTIVISKFQHLDSELQFHQITVRPNIALL